MLRRQSAVIGIGRGVVLVKRQEAIELLKEISSVCGDDLSIDSVSLEQTTVLQPSDALGAGFKLRLLTSLDLSGDKRVVGILRRRGLEISREGGFTVICRHSELSALAAQ